MVNGRTNDSKISPASSRINRSECGNLGLEGIGYDGAMGACLRDDRCRRNHLRQRSAPKVYAVEASTGKLLLKYDPQIRLDQALTALILRAPMGVAVWNGKVYVGTGDLPPMHCHD